jgi:hypothetical protein
VETTISLVLVLADLSGTAGAISGMIAAVAAVVSIRYARLAAIAGRDAIREQRDLRAEQDYRDFATALWEVLQAADTAKNQPLGSPEMAALRRRQKRLQAAVLMPRWVDLGSTGLQMMDKVGDLNSGPRQVNLAASTLVVELQAAWDRRLAEHRASSVRCSACP